MFCLISFTSGQLLYKFISTLKHGTFWVPLYLTSRFARHIFVVILVSRYMWYPEFVVLRRKFWCSSTIAHLSGHSGNVSQVGGTLAHSIPTFPTLKNTICNSDRQWLRSMDSWTLVHYLYTTGFYEVRHCVANCGYGKLALFYLWWCWCICGG